MESDERTKQLLVATRLQLLSSAYASQSRDPETLRIAASQLTTTAGRLSKKHQETWLDDSVFGVVLNAIAAGGLRSNSQIKAGLFQNPRFGAIHQALLGRRIYDEDDLHEDENWSEREALNQLAALLLKEAEEADRTATVEQQKSAIDVPTSDGTFAAVTQLSPNAFKVLRELNNSPTTLTKTNISGRCDMSRKTAADVLKELDSAGFAESLGERSGWKITPAGRSACIR